MRLSRRRLGVGAASAALALAGRAFAQAEPDGPAGLPGAVRFDLGAGAGGAPWRITLYVPPGPPPAAGWPVLYLLDGDAVTATAIDVERVQGAFPAATGIASRFAVVGVGYPGDGAYDHARRSRDYTPPPGRSYPPFTPGAADVRTGGADAFLRFVTDTLIPAIDRRCPTDPARRGLFGHSFGGLFVLYALGNRPDAFSHWIAASPSIYWEDGAVLPSIARLEGGARVPARVLLLAGAYEEELAPFQRDAPDSAARAERLAVSRTVGLARDMAGRLGRIPGVSSRFRLIPERTHMSVLPDAVNDAAGFLMEPLR